jgi:16S rRNA (adenine1518-N6/adenine1519-N6)-dimethyltransferase
MNKSEINSVLEKIQAAPLKKMGQNFLICQKVLEKIIQKAKFDKKDNILEIGPGLGVLTEKILLKSNKVLAIEKDPKFSSYLRKKFNCKENKKIEIIQGDILKINIPRLLKGKFIRENTQKSKTNNYKIAANLPYNIATKVIRLFIEMENRPSKMVTLVQKEVAERICSEPPKMNPLALRIKLVAKPKIALLVKSHCFYPEPKVSSALLVLEKINSKVDFKEEKLVSLLRLIKVGFASPRKTLLNNLVNGLGFNKTELRKILKEYPEKIRAQELTIENWKNIQEKIKQISVKNNPQI